MFKLAREQTAPHHLPRIPSRFDSIANIWNQGNIRVLVENELVCARLTAHGSSPDHLLEVGGINVVSDQVKGRDVEAGLKCKDDVADFVAKLFHSCLHGSELIPINL